MYKVRDRHNLPKVELTKCEQEDNIQRDGYVSTEELYNSFARAGINRMEWLKKAYPQGGITNEQIETNGVTMMNGINMRKAETLDILDEKSRVKSQIERNTKIQKTLKEEREKLEQEYNKKPVIENEATPKV